MLPFWSLFSWTMKLSSVNHKIVSEAPDCTEAILTLPKHPLHKVDTITHHHPKPLNAVLASHRLDLHTLYDRLLDSESIFGDLAKTSLVERVESVCHLDKLTILTVGCMFTF